MDPVSKAALPQNLRRIFVATLLKEPEKDEVWWFHPKITPPNTDTNQNLKFLQKEPVTSSVNLHAYCIVQSFIFYLCLVFSKQFIR